MAAAVDRRTRLRGFLVLVGDRFLRHEGPQNAAALTYTTLLSLVPLMAVTLAAFSAFRWPTGSAISYRTSCSIILCRPR